MKCTTPHCKNQVKGGTCSTCRSRKSREKDPIRYSLNILRARAVRGKIFFDLTYEQFKAFCYETNYIAGKGKTKGSYNVDRRIEGPLPGYTYGNLQKLEKMENINKYLHYDWQNRTATVITETKQEAPPDDGEPF